MYRSPAIGNLFYLEQLLVPFIVSQGIKVCNIYFIDTPEEEEKKSSDVHLNADEHVIIFLGGPGLCVVCAGATGQHEHKGNRGNKVEKLEKAVNRLQGQ